jgi:peptidyl-prolyl cis-trans isomerase C
MMCKKILFFMRCYLFLPFVLLALPLPAGAETAPDEAVVAESRGMTVTAKELTDEVAFIQRSKSLQSRPARSTLEQLAHQVLTRKLLVQQAEKAKLGQEPWVRYGIERGRQSVLVKAFMEQVGTDLTDPQRETLAREYYLVHPAEFAAEGKRALSHILIGLKGRTEAEAMALAEDVAQQIAEEPARFQALARRHSDDPGSRAKGGGLGWVKRKTLVKPFAEAAFGLAKVGQISPVVKSRFGYHIIRLDGLPSGEALTFDQVKASIYPRVTAEYRKLKRKQYLDNLRASSTRRVDPDALKRVQQGLE